jgi:polysaccharide export outer membrane protein
MRFFLQIGRRIALPLLCLAAFGADSAVATPPATSPSDFPAAPAAASEIDYRIGALDKLNITVFQVKELTIDKLQVDAGGQILLPLIGSVIAKGKTTAALSVEIARRLGEHYLQAPQVSVTVEEAVSQKVSVEGAVTESGVFELKGRTSLLEAVARAKGFSKNANPHKVTIVRTVDGVQHAASFDLAKISAGKAPNPEVVGNDVVIVDGSQTKSAWRGFIEAMPALYWLSFL